MPRTLGDSFIHLSQIDSLVESDRPILECAPPEPDDVARRIGENVADMVEDEYQGQGIGTFLLHYLVQVAKRIGVVGFTAEVLADNTSMVQVFGSSGYTLQTRLSGGVYSLSFTFDTFQGAAGEDQQRG